MPKAVGEYKSSYWNELVPGLRFFHMEEMRLCNQLPLRIVDLKCKLAVLESGISHITLQFIARKKDMSVNICPENGGQNLYLTFLVYALVQFSSVQFSRSVVSDSLRPH